MEFCPKCNRAVCTYTMDDMVDVLRKKKNYFCQECNEFIRSERVKCDSFHDYFVDDYSEEDGGCHDG